MDNLSKRNLLTNFFALLVTLLVLYWISAKILSKETADILALIEGICIKVFVTLDILKNNDIFGPVVRQLRKRTKYLDLVLLAVGIQVIVSIFVNSFEYALIDMQEKGLISFDKKLNGLEHLVIYLHGYLATPLLILVLGGYGVSLGRQNKFSFFELAVCLLGAVFFIKALLLIGGVDRYEEIYRANPQLPIGSTPLLVVFRVSLYTVQALVYASYVWLIATLTKRWPRQPEDNQDSVGYAL